MKKHLPAKPPTVTDIALRQVLNDLIDRGQIPVLLSLASELGFKTTGQLRFFINEERNFPRAKVPHAVDKLSDKYRVNKDFLLTGHGKMYNGKPYLSSESIPVIEHHPNITSIGGVKKMQELEKQLAELEKKNKELEKLLRDKQELIATQRDLISELKASPAKTRTKKRT